MLLFRTPKVNKTLARLNPIARAQEKRLMRYLETESHEWMDVIERRREERDEKERQIDLALHHERREGSNWLENREMRMSEMALGYERTSIFDRIEIRKRLALECPELLSDAELSKLEESMLRLAWSGPVRMPFNPTTAESNQLAAKRTNHGSGRRALVAQLATLRDYANPKRTIVPVEFRPSWRLAAFQAYVLNVSPESTRSPARWPRKLHEEIPASEFPLHTNYSCSVW